MLLMEQMDLANQRVLIREDFNVPMKDGKITHTARIDAALPTIELAIQMGAKIILLSHLGRPNEGEFDPALSLKPIAEYLSACLKKPVTLFQLSEGLPPLQSGDVALMENVRFLSGEEANAPALAKQLASLCDIFVMDAFAVAHRAQASTVGVAEFAKVACAGPLLRKECEAIEKVLASPQRPVLAIVGGAKVSTKLNLLNNLLEKVDVLALGGGIANTFLAAQGYPVGDSLYEQSFIPEANEIMSKAHRTHKQIWLATDVVVAPTLDAKQGVVKECSEVKPGDKIFDIGPQSEISIANLVKEVKTILWNGPLGVFEYPPFAQGTKALAIAISKSDAYSVAGGGDTCAAIEQFNISDSISYLSTGGGAFLEAIEGKTLPAVAILEKRANTNTEQKHATSN